MYLEDLRLEDGANYVLVIRTKDGNYEVDQVMIERNAESTDDDGSLVFIVGVKLD